MPHHFTPGEPGQAAVHGPRRRRVAVHALLIPADPGRRCELRELALTAASLSDAIGGGLLNELLIETVDGVGYSVCADADRITHGIPENTRGLILAALLGWTDLVHTCLEPRIADRDREQAAANRTPSDRVIHNPRPLPARCGGEPVRSQA